MEGLWDHEDDEHEIEGSDQGCNNDDLSLAMAVAGVNVSA